MFYINNMTQMSCNFKEQSKIVRTGGIPLWGEGPEPSQAATHSVPPSHLPVKQRVLVAGFPRGGAKSAKKSAGKTRHCKWPTLGERAGWSAV